MSGKTTRDADGHPHYSHRHTHTDPAHHVGVCYPTDRAGKLAHVHRKSGEKMTAAVERKIESAYRRKFLKRGFSAKTAARKAAYVAGAVVGEVTGKRGRRRRR